MANEICIFKRVEKKYMLTVRQKDRLLGYIENELLPDPYGKSTICSAYLDTPQHLIIRNSLDARSYKEKLRIRSYGTPEMDSNVFFELKKKYMGLVYKRRAVMNMSQAISFAENGIPPFQSQIISEIGYALNFYGHPQPAVMIAYEREAYFVKELPNLRLTFDTNVRYRTENPLPCYGDGGKQILPSDRVLLEIKTDGAMPISFSRALDKCGILPISFSKYGTAYRDICGLTAFPSVFKNFTDKGEMKNVCNF